jgi:DNA topoisomerase-1
MSAECPECGGKILRRRGKNKSYFYSCEKYPECKFSVSDTPVGGRKCPECGGLLLKKKGKDIIYCYNKDCKYQEEAEKPESAEESKETETTAEE